MKKTKFKQRSKNNILVSSLALLMLLLSLFLCSNFNFTKSVAKASTNNEIIYDTNFMYSPTSAVEFNDTTLVLDTAANTILKVKDSKIVQGESSTANAHNSNYMFYLNSKIILVNTHSQTLQDMITILVAETLENVYLAQSLDTQIYSYYDRISSYIDNNTLYLLFYEFGINDGVSNMMLLSITIDEQEINISEPKQITVNADTVGTSFSSNIKSINIVKYPNDTTLSCLVHKTNDVFSSPIEELTLEEQTITNEQNDYVIRSINSTTIINSLGTTPFKSLKILTYNNNPYIAIEKENLIDIYNLEKVNDYFGLSTTPLSVNTGLSSHDSIEVNGSSLLICSISAQKIYRAVISSQDSKLSLSNTKTISNPTIETNLYDTEELTLAEITSDTTVSMLELPYSTKGLVTLSQGANIVEIGEGVYKNEENNNTETVNGYKYYLATVNGTNYYGYLPISVVTKLDVSESIMPYAFTRKNIKMYKYPTSSQDQINTVLHTFEEITKVELVRDISTFKYTVGSNNALRSFYEVQINNQVGYILSTDIDSFPEIELVQTNAVVLRTTSVYKNLRDELPTWNLSEGTRVRILENRFGTEKYAKISFNDDDGVTCTGYILADNIQADSWSTLQIIGFVLVLLSIVLLVIILIIRHRINKE